MSSLEIGNVKYRTQGNINFETTGNNPENPRFHLARQTPAFQRCLALLASNSADSPQSLLNENRQSKIEA